ncbi:MAG TPA: hypothetical protein PKM54_06105 [Anaerolineales bacterium]|nr:hypothetical protein [Anaerolineales bacterium]
MDILSERMSELKRKSIQEDLDAIHLEEEAVKGKTLLDKNLAWIGNWMVSRGEKLRNRYNQSLHDANSTRLVKKATYHAK